MPRRPKAPDATEPLFDATPRADAQKRWLESRPAPDKIDWTTGGFEAA